MEKIVITGKPGSGKSTLARYLLAGFAQPWAGYQTVQESRCPAGPLYCLEGCPGGESGPISRWEDGGIGPVTQTFETLGTASLRRALEGPEPIVLMDEVGRFERSCTSFLQSIRQVMASDKTVIAVVKKEPLPHLQQLLQWPGAICVDLDEITPHQARCQLAARLWPQKALHWGLTLRLYGVGKSFGPGPMQLLEGVAQTGSLHQAAHRMGMAYSKAWKIINTLEEEWGFALLRRAPGGSGGGGSALTEEGRELLVRYSAMLTQVEQAAEKAFRENFADGKFF